MLFLLFVTSAAAEANTSTPSSDREYGLLAYSDKDGVAHRVENVEEWATRRKQILSNFQLVSGALPNSSRKVPFDMRVEEEAEFPSYFRKKITFAVEPGDRLPAYLLLPKKSHGKMPAALCLHPTSPLGKRTVVGLGDLPNWDYAKELAERGYVALAPDYPGYGDYENIDVYGMGYVSATAKGIWNHMRCVDLLRSLPEVDGGRIACIGHSLGGHNTLFLGMFDTRVRVMVTSCGFNRFAKYYGGDLTGWSHKGYMPRIAALYGKDPARMPFDFPEVLAALAPRAVFINAPENDENFEVSGVRDCIRAAMPVYRLFDAEDKLQAAHPECDHDFPPEVREQAYAFMDAALEHQRP
ncbi:MAG: alpha/beta fold hydrolase [Candidatus Hydrogenedentes bacterium]|nr:alpha/beta fold hydrolase [Candidatus Hydrogenedentota bacterium]